MQHYRPSIPRDARERIVARYPNAGQRKTAEYRLNRALVGVRHFHPSGELLLENPMRDGLLHGVVYRCDDPGKVTSAEPWSKGLPHGTARQYSRDGALLGTYRMERGTGLDLWWDDTDPDAPRLSEARLLKGGKWHGFEWWLRVDQQSVWEERHFAEGRLHGIERLWNDSGRLRRGYPRYWVRGRRVARRRYLQACKEDETLPRYRKSDDRTLRVFPPEVARHLR
jgi:hypothetical protein